MQIRTRNLNDSLESKEIRKAVKFYIDLLLTPRQQKNLKLTITMENLPYKAYMEWLDKPVKPKEFRIVLNKKNRRRESLLSLAHEMVHLKQYVVGELSDATLRSNAKWKKEELNEEEIHYYDLPYEIEAFGRERGLYIRFLESLSKERADSKSRSRGIYP